MTSSLLPIQVVIQPIGGGTHLDITASTANLRWSSCSPGGYAECSFDFNHELTFLDEDVYGQYSPITIYDTRDSEVLWDGLLADPGRYSGPDGEAWRMVAYGAMSTTKNINRPWIILDTSLESWGRGAAPFMRETVQIDVDQQTEGDPEETFFGPAVLINAPAGTFFESGRGVGYVHYLPMMQTRQLMGSLATFDITMGQDAGFIVGHDFGLDSLDGVFAASHPASSTPTSAVFRAGTGWSGDANTAALALARVGPDAVSGQECWTRFYRIAVRPTLVDRDGDGVSIPDPYETNWREQVENLVGSPDRLRFATGAHCDIDDDGVLDENITPITKLAYFDAVTDDQLLSDLLLCEGRATWHFWQRVGDNLYWFEWVAKGSGVNFELDTTLDGFDSPGSTDELIKTVNVRVRDETGNINFIRVTAGSSPVLDAAGVHREDTVDLGDNVGSSFDEMSAAADAYLDAHKIPIRSGVGTITRSIYSNFTSEWVEPWRLRAPFRVRYSGAVVDTPGTEPDGQSVFDVVRVEFDANSVAATLDLSEPEGARWDPESVGRGRRR